MAAPIRYVGPVSVDDPGGVLRATSLGAGPHSRVFEASWPVRLGDANEHGRLRLDALARHLQDVATDDSHNFGMGEEPIIWVVRRAAVTVERWPRYLESIDYRTFCTGAGPRWAERRTSGRSGAGGHLEAAVLWAAVDATTGRPALLSERFDQVWGRGVRQVSARLLHPRLRPEPWAGRGPSARPPRLAHHLNLKPVDPEADACAQRLGCGFLGGKACGKTFSSIALALAIDLLRREITRSRKRSPNDPWTVGCAQSR